MCIIAIKPAGVKFPADTTIKNMWANNPDGAGLMYSTGRNVIIKKGYMQLKNFKIAIKQLKKDIDTTATPMILHFRITTHGGTTPGNTHPFPISNKIPLLQSLNLKTKIGIAHNGVIDIAPIKKDISDTMGYIMTQLTPLYKLSKMFYKNPAGIELVKNAIQSKMVIMDGDGYITTIGDFIEVDGIKYSNTSYKKRTNYFKWDLGIYDDYEWYESRFGRYMCWLSDDDGYIIADGEIYDPDYFLIDKNGNLYAYDLETDAAGPICGEFYNHAGKSINPYKDGDAQYMEIID